MNVNVSACLVLHWPIFTCSLCIWHWWDTRSAKNLFLWHTAYMCKLSYKNNAFSVEHLRCTVHNAEKYWHCNLGVFTDDAPVCKVFTVDLYLILLFCLTCNHLTKLSENNSVIILCPTVLGAQLQFCPQTKPVHVSAPLFSLIGTRSVARTILKHRATELNLEHHLMMPRW